MGYCTREDLIERLGASGLLFVADDDADETASETERTASLDRAIAAAGAEIDAALTPHVTVPAPNNEWLKQRAIDLATEHLAERRGAVVPPSLSKAAERSRAWLELVRRGALRVPDLAYPADRFQEVRDTGLPRVCNPGADERSTQ